MVGISDDTKVRRDGLVFVDGHVDVVIVMAAWRQSTGLRFGCRDGGSDGVKASSMSWSCSPAIGAVGGELGMRFVVFGSSGIASVRGGPTEMMREGLIASAERSVVVASRRRRLVAGEPASAWLPLHRSLSFADARPRRREFATPSSLSRGAHDERPSDRRARCSAEQPFVVTSISSERRRTRARLFTHWITSPSRHSL